MVPIRIILTVLTLSLAIITGGCTHQPPIESRSAVILPAAFTGPVSAEGFNRWKNLPTTADIPLVALAWDIPTINTCGFRAPEGYRFDHRMTGEILRQAVRPLLPQVIPPWLWGDFHTRGRDCLVFELVGSLTDSTSWSLQSALSQGRTGAVTGGQWIGFSPYSHQREWHMQLLLLHPSPGEGDWGMMVQTKRSIIRSGGVRWLEYTIELPNQVVANYFITVSGSDVQQELLIPNVELTGQTIRPGLRIVLRPEVAPPPLRDLLTQPGQPRWQDVVRAFPRAFVLAHWLART